jgi:glycine/D-amino acid oxidase-like deaminating enzyme
MANKYERVVVIGVGVSGLSTAYYLALAGLPSVVVERDAIGSHASGFAYGSSRARGFRARFSPRTGGIPVEL